METEIQIVDAPYTTRIGEELLLHKVASPDRDSEQDEFVRIKIVEERHVLEVWSQKDHFITSIGKARHFYWGFKAIGDNGETYRNNWESFPGDSSSPGWIWTKDMNETEGETLKNVVSWYEWYDVIVGVFHLDFRPIIVNTYPDLVVWCDEHKSLYYKVGKCFMCESDEYLKKKDPAKFAEQQRIKAEKQEKERKWKGWK